MTIQQVVAELENIKEQVPEYILDLAQGLFCCGGNQFYVDYQLHYENRFTPPETLIEHLEERLDFHKALRLFE